MPRARVNGHVELEWDSFGREDAPPVLLVMGLGSPMIYWDERLCEDLASRGRRVIRFDNRDCGLSTKFDDHGAPDLGAIVTALASGSKPPSAYLLSDMAADVAGLLEALGIDTAHVVGASLGGMIAQTLAIEHPSRVRTLTSIMSTTGRAGLPGPTPEAPRVLLTPPPDDREGAIERAVDTWRTISGPGFPFDEAMVRDRAGRAFDRGQSPAGTARQLAAILASGGREERLAAVAAPTLVIHGDLDPLVPIDGGRDTAACIPGAEFLAVSGMGHSLPVEVWPTVLDAIERHTARA
ncbi:MAG: alpha/beta fold hydrolase [Alphaproteobacteria bacterium]